MRHHKARPLGQTLLISKRCKFAFFLRNYLLAVCGGLVSFGGFFAVCQESGTKASSSTNAYAWQAVPVRLSGQPSDDPQILEARGAFFDHLVGSDSPLDRPSQYSQGHSAGAPVQDELPTHRVDACRAVLNL